MISIIIPRNNIQEEPPLHQDATHEVFNVDEVTVQPQP